LRHGEANDLERYQNPLAMKCLIISIALFLYPLLAWPQVGVDNTDPHPSSVLDLNSTDKGLLIPRMTTIQREAIVSPANSLLVYDTSLGRYFYYRNGQWTQLDSPWNRSSSSAIYYNSGNVGIGNASPNAPLQFATVPAERKIVLIENVNNDHQFYGFGVQEAGNLKYQVSGTGSSHVWYAATSATTSRELMRVAGNGNLGIRGTPVYDFHLFKNASTALVQQLLQTGDGGVEISLRRNAGTVANWSMYIQPGSTDLKLWSVGDKFIFSTTGVATGIDWVATSDRRLKENVKSVKGQLDKVRAISHYVVNYDRKDTGKNETGFIAQELFKVAPEYVNVPEDPKEMQSVNYAKMVVPLYKGTSELSDEVEKLKKKLAEESEEVAQLREQVAQMQQLKREVEELKALLRNSMEPSSGPDSWNSTTE